MKKLLLALLFATGISQAQVLNIPDPEFKYNLIMNGVDTNNDGDIQVTEALATTTLSIHHIQNDFLTDITGLEAFVNLTNLDISGWPSLGGTLNVSMMPNLVTLDCSVGNFTAINVTGLSHLEKLICEFNMITSLDLSGCVSLKEIDCSDIDGLTALDLSQTPSLEIFKANFSAFPNLNFNAAPMLKTIECEGSLTGTVDVSALTHLETLTIPNNSITALHLGQITNLKHLDCTLNQLTSLDVSAQINLEYLSCAANQLSAINVVPLVNLIHLDCSSNTISTLNVTTLAQLESLACTSQQLTELDLSGVPNLQYLYCSENSINSLNLSQLPELIMMMCNNNPIPSLDFSMNPELRYIDCNYTQIASLDVSMLSDLTILVCGNEQLVSLNIDTPSLDTLQMSECPLITSIDFSNKPNLESVSIGNSAVNLLDFSECPELRVISINSSPNLTYINIKNGNPWDLYLGIGNAPSLTYICANENHIVTLQEAYPTLLINSYCSFVPGGAYNSIGGTLLFDADQNGCDASDTIQPYAKIILNDGTNEGAAFLNPQSEYEFYTGTGDFTLSVALEEPSYFNISTVPVVNFATTSNLTATRNICMTPNGMHPDVEVLIMQNRNAVPGFDAEYKVIYRNKGNQTVNGSVAVTFDDTRLNFVSAVPAVDFQTTGILTWDYLNLLPFETRVIDFKVNVNTPMETPAVNDGDILDYTATLSFTVPDVSTNSTSAQLHQIVQNSLDPNDKTCLEGNTISPDMIGDYVHYNINFENIGTAPAQNVVVKDVIDTSKFDISTLQLIYASHPVAARINGNVVEFIFQGINLPGTAGENKGNVVFKIKTWPTLVLGNSISNQAEIFFDYNFPIETNEATSTFSLLKNNEFKTDTTIGIAPNPAKSKVNIKANSMIKSLQLFDIQGRLLQASTENTTEVSFDISGKQNGVYFLKVTTEKGSKVEKLIKD